MDDQVASLPLAAMCGDSGSKEVQAGDAAQECGLLADPPLWPTLLKSSENFFFFFKDS